MSDIFDGVLDGLDLNDSVVAGSVLALPVGSVQAKPQVRRAFPPASIKEMAQSISAQGQIQPIIVEGPDAEGIYTIQKGERRWRACTLLGITVDCIVREPLPDGDAVASQLVENIQREDLNPFEIGAGLSRLLDGGLSKAKIAVLVGKDRKYVSVHLACVGLPNDVQTLCNQRGLSVHLTYELSLLADKNPDGFQAAVAALNSDASISRDYLRGLVGGKPAAKSTDDSAPTTEPDDKPGMEVKDKNSRSDPGQEVVKLSPIYTVGEVECKLIAVRPTKENFAVVDFGDSQKEVKLCELRVAKVFADRD